MPHFGNFGKSILFVAVLFGLALGVFVGGFVEGYASAVPEKLSSYDHVDESEILLTGNTVLISTGHELRWSKFEDTNSMNPLIDKGHNGLELAKEIGVSSQVLSYHIRSLIKWEMVERKRTGLKNSLYITELGIEALTKDL